MVFRGLRISRLLFADEVVLLELTACSGTVCSTVLKAGRPLSTLNSEAMVLPPGKGGLSPSDRREATASDGGVQ